MTTSGITAWSLTARDVVQQAMAQLGVTDLGEDPDASELTYALFQLNGLIKSWQGGLHLETTGTVTIPAASPSGELAADVQEIISARHSGTFERQLQRFGRDDYMILPNKAAIGEPTAFYVSNQRDATVMYVWPVPSAQTVLTIDYRRKPETITSASETVDFPEEYHETLIANLAVRLMGRFGDGINQLTVSELTQRAERLRVLMEDQERPASYMLGGF